MMLGMSTATTTAVQPVVVEPPARRGTAAIVGLGVALLGAAAAVSALYTREDGDIDWSVYVIGLGVTAALLLVTLAGAVGHDLGTKRALTGFPGAVGALAAGAMVGVGFDDESWVDWAVGGVILGVAVVAYLLGRAGAPTVAAIVGLLVLYGKAVDEVIDPSGDNELIVGGAVVVVFVVGVTALGWLLPQRALIGTVAGAIGVVGIAGLLAAATIAASFYAYTPSMPLTEDPRTMRASELENDVYVFLAYSAGLILLWILASWATGSSGFRVLAVVHSAVIVPLSMTVLVTEHPTWWGAALAVAGGVVLLLALLAARRRRPATPPPATDPPRPFFDSPPPPATPASTTPAGAESPTPPPGKTDATVITPADAPPPPRPGDRRPT